MKRIIAIASVALLAGCSSLPMQSIRLEAEHVSHPLAGWPVNDSNNEDALTQVNVLKRYENHRFYVEHGIGWNLQGEHGGGFYGPGLTYTARVGVVLWGRQ